MGTMIVKSQLFDSDMCSTPAIKRTSGKKYNKEISCAISEIVTQKSRVDLEKDGFSRVNFGTYVEKKHLNNKSSILNTRKW